MKSKRITGLLTFLTALLVLSGVSLAKDYRYQSATEVKQKIENQRSLTLIDIQVAEEFNRHHIAGAVATYAYPVKTTEDKAKLADIITQLKGNDDPAVIICPRGGGGARRTYDHLVAAGIPKKRLTILTEGQAGWPYPELLKQEQ